MYDTVLSEFFRRERYKLKRHIKKYSVLILLIFSMILGLISNVFSPIMVNATGIGTVYYALDEGGNAEPFSVTKTTNGDVSIGMADDGAVYEVSGDNGIIIVEPNVTVTLILTGVSRTSNSGVGLDSRSPLQIGSGANVTIIILDDTNNIFECNSTATPTSFPSAGIHVPGISSGTYPIATPANLTIRQEANNTGNTGTLRATAGSYSAGIGGGPNQTSGNIMIIGGVITAETRIYSTQGSSVGANPGNGAGIGSGGGRTGLVPSNAASTIIIGGTADVTATSAGSGAGIGGGASFMSPSGTSGTIEIRGMAKVTATSEMHGAGIGGGGNGNSSAASGGIIKIYGGADVIATSKGNGAGIGGGGIGFNGDTENTATGVSGYGTGNGNIGGSINIYGDVKVAATSEKNGAGIGSGGNEKSTTGYAATDSGGVINFYGNADVIATSKGNGAGIGGGGSEIGAAGNGTAASPQPGFVSFYGNVTIVSTSKGNGAGIGGGGSQSGNGGNGSNGSGTLSIYGNADITATSKGNGAGIGGGGSGSGTAGGGGTLSISENPIVVATTEGSSPNAVGIGPGVRGSTNALGSVGNRYITSGNVYTSKASVVRNGSANGNNTLLMSKIVIKDLGGDPVPNKKLTFTAIGSTQNYEYTATTDANGEAYIWIIAGTQLVICIDEDTNEQIQSEMIDVRGKVNVDTTIPIPLLDKYTSRETIPEVVKWIGGTTLLETIVYNYTPDRVLTLKAYDEKTGEQIGIVTYKTSPLPVEQDYDYESDIDILTARVEATYPDRYLLTPNSDPKIVRIERDPNTNEIKIYYDPQKLYDIEVELRFNDINGTILETYTIPADKDETITLTRDQMPDIVDYDVVTSLSIITAQEGKGEKIILVYIDVRRKLTITKTVDGEYGDLTLPFTFNATFTSDGTTPYIEIIEYRIIGDGVTRISSHMQPSQSGEMTFTLKHNEQIEFKFFDNGDDIVYEVVEMARVDYNTYVDDVITAIATGTIANGGPSVMRNYRNDKAGIVVTAVRNTPFPLGIIIVVAFILLVLYVLFRYKIIKMRWRALPRRRN